MKKHPVQYKITEKPVPKQDWYRVVAVIVMGKKWQFKDFPYNGVKDGNLVDLFSAMCGFYFHYSNDPIPKEVEQWNVKPIAIDKNNRHKDIAAFREFWAKLDGFLGKKNLDFVY